MIYRVFDPSPELASFIRCFWSLEGEKEPQPSRQRVIPDGCMEMIFHYGDRYEQFFENGTSIIQPLSFIFGQIASYIEIAPTGITGIIGARFQPDGLLPFLEIPLSSLDNKAVDLHSIFGEKGSMLEREVLVAPNNSTRMKLIESFLLTSLTSPHASDIITKNCVELIIRSQGQLAMEELADQVSINRRNMERRFLNKIGMSPKQLSKVIRLQSALRMMEQNNYTNLTSLSYENGYYDQAHFIKDFREFTGLNPRSFYAGNFQLAAFFASSK